MSKYGENTSMIHSEGEWFVWKIPIYKRKAEKISVIGIDAHIESVLW